MELESGAQGLRIVQVVNTLDHLDGGPARNAFELNLSLNAEPRTRASLVWLRGEKKDSVVHTFETAGGSLPAVPPRRVRWRSPVNGQHVSLAQIWHEVRNADALILHGYYLWWVPAFAALGWLARTAVFVMPHGALTRYERGRKRTKKAIFHLAAGWWLNRILTAIVTGSQSERRELIADGIGRRVEYAGVGTALPSKAPQDRAPSGPIRLLTMSRIAPKKRIDIAVKAVNNLLESGLNVQLTIAGAGDHETEREIRGLIKSLDLDDAVRMVGLVKGADKEQLLDASDVFLLPSEDENFGIGVAEASMHGLFVVASTKVAAATMLGEGAVTLLETPDPTSFAEAVRCACEADRVGRKSAISAEAQRLFSWSTVAQRWVRLLAAAPRT